MAYTEAQWNKFQASLPPEDRLPYLTYLQETDPGAYNKAIGATLSRLKAESQEPAKTTVVDERTKLAGAKADTAAQKKAAANNAGILSRLKADAAEPVTKTSVSAVESAAEARAVASGKPAGTITGITTTTPTTTTPTTTTPTTTTPTTTTPTTTTPTTTTPTTTTPTTTTPTTTTPTTTTPTTTTPTTTTPTGGPGEQPGAAWVLSADGKSWVRPPMPTEKNKAFSWDDNQGWIGFTIGNEFGEDVEGGDPDAEDTPRRPIGTPPAFVWDPISKTWKMPEKPTEEGNWVWDNIKGWTKTGVTPGSTGFEAGNERTLAQDTFKNTLALFLVQMKCHSHGLMLYSRSSQVSIRLVRLLTSHLI
jgi:hypothetical protein